MSKKLGSWAMRMITIAVIFIGVTTFFVIKPGIAPHVIRSTAQRLHRLILNDQPNIEFKNVAAKVGIDFKHFNGTRTNQIPEDMGSGAAWLDYDKDGWQDLFVSNISGPLTLSKEEVQQSPAHSRLYHNNGDGSFTDVTEKAGVAWHGYGMGVSAGDYNNDGWPDLFLANRGHNVLYKNNGDGTFTDRTKDAGLYDFEGFWSDGRWGDYDRDGNLDLYVTGYVKYQKMSGGDFKLSRANRLVPVMLSPEAFHAVPNLLFHNNGDGTFTENSLKAEVMNTGGRSLSSSWCDYNNDRWPDLLIANDVGQNKLYINRKNGTFLDVKSPSYKMQSRGSMGIAVGDVDEDLDMDVYITNWFNEKNDFFINQTNRISGEQLYHFIDATDPYGVGKPSIKMIAWGTGFYDFDNDTQLDLFITNGSTNPQEQDSTKLVTMPNQFYWNKGFNKGFTDMTAACGNDLSKKIVGRGAAFADYDNDGDVDIFVVNHGGKGILFQNNGGNKKNWLEVALEGTQSNRSAIGARLRLSIGDHTYIREIGAQSSYLSQNSLTEHFGLGDYQNIDSLVVQWPSGSTQQFTDLPVNKIINIKEGEKPISMNNYQ